MLQSVLPHLGWLLFYLLCTTDKWEGSIALHQCFSCLLWLKVRIAGWNTKVQCLIRSDFPLVLVALQHPNMTQSQKCSNEYSETLIDYGRAEDPQSWAVKGCTGRGQSGSPYLNKPGKSWGGLPLNTQNSGKEAKREASTQFAPGSWGNNRKSLGNSAPSLFPMKNGFTMWIQVPRNSPQYKPEKNYSNLLSTKVI